jgi:hypothetical protein
MRLEGEHGSLVPRAAEQESRIDAVVRAYVHEPTTGGERRREESKMRPLIEAQRAGDLEPDGLPPEIRRRTPQANDDIEDDLEKIEGRGP